jgi:hypothetical protein
MLSTVSNIENEPELLHYAYISYPVVFVSFLVLHVASIDAIRLTF